ncbi:unnamed protein product [Caenorhabditis nigoni]
MESEILQSSDNGKAKLTKKVDAIDNLSIAIAVFEKNDPASVDEKEYMEILFNSLCAPLMHPPNRKKFLDASRREEKLFQMKLSSNRLDMLLGPIDNLGDDATLEKERVSGHAYEDFEELYK